MPIEAAVRPNRHEPCLCGSGKLFRNCCRDRLPVRVNYGYWREEAQAKRWLAAIKLMRANVTQYTLWHRRDTVPRAPNYPVFEGRSLLKIDVEALSDHVGELTGGYHSAGIEARVPAMLARLRTNIDDPSWHAKIAYHLAIYHLLREDRDSAIAAFAEAGPIDPDCDDVDLLQCHLDLHGSNMGLTLVLAYMDRILELTRNRAEKIQYSGARAFRLVMAGDEQGAEAALREAVRQAREVEAEKPLSPLAEFWFCRVLEGLAFTAGDQALFDEIVERLERLLSEVDGRLPETVPISRGIADAHRYAGRFAPAIAAYQQAYEAGGDASLLIFAAECHLRLGGCEKAFNILEAIDPSSFDTPEQADYAFTYFYVAIARKDRASLEQARTLLEQASTPQAYFDKLRLAHIITVQDALRALAENRPIPKPRPIATLLRSFSRYVQLQPNFNGVGFNLNNVLDDLADRLDGGAAGTGHEGSS